VNTIVTNPNDFSQKSADLVSQKIIELQLDASKIVNLVLATGSTMIEFLDCLSQEKGIDWSRVQAFHLDEYKGLSIDHPSSFSYFLNKNLFSRISIPPKNINYINGANPDIPVYMAKLKNSGGADIVMLGVGMDGHLAFNEPPLYSNFDGRMGEVKLTQSTIEANKPDYSEIETNPNAFSMGMADIFEGKNLFFLAKGDKKADIVAKSLQGPITPDIPASILQKHPNVTVVLDTESSSQIHPKI
jgi:glucosamine-6-phosphate deaminase